jgi:hypothetical protein
MNSYEPIDLNVKNYREPKYISKFALLNLKFENKNTISSEREKSRNQLFNINNNPINNQLALYKKRKRFSNQKNMFMTTIERGISLNKRGSVEIPRTTTKKTYEKYNIQKDFDSFKNNRNNFLALSRQSSNSQLEKNIKQTIIIMRNEIETKKKKFQEKMKNPDNKFISTENVINDLKTNKKFQSRSRLSLPNIEQIKKNNSFEYNEKSQKKIIKRLKTEINYKCQNEGMLKRYSEVIASGDDDSDENSEVINSRDISFSPNSNFLLFFDLLIIIANLYSLIVIPLNIAKDKNILKKESNTQELFKYLNDIIYLFVIDE